jgi:hypothetical protein
MLVVMSAALYAVLVGVESLVRRRWRVS